MTTYLQAITPTDHDCSNFDPKDKQKAVYQWYDSRYSDEALDIYSKEWQQRILEWHEAHQQALEDTNNTLASEELLEKLGLGMFFLAHPIAAFSLWKVLQTCYDLDRAVCGESDEVASWQRLPPFKYLRDSSIQLRWKAELGRLKEQVKSHSLNFRKQSWETKLYQILLGIERFENAFAGLRENFSVNLVDMKFAPWMIDRIDEDVEKRFAMISELLKFKEHELENIRPTESHEDDFISETSPAPKYSRAPTFPPAYPSPVKPKFNPNDDQPAKTQKSEPEPEPESTANSAKTGGMMSSLRSGVNGIKREVRKHKNFVKSLGRR